MNKLEQFIAAKAALPTDAWIELRKIRKGADKFLSDVATATGLSIQYISDMELGQRPMTVAIAEYYLQMAKEQQ